MIRVIIIKILTHDTIISNTRVSVAGVPTGIEGVRDIDVSIKEYNNNNVY